MEAINEKSKVDTIFKFTWKSSIGEHIESYFCKINIWREFELLPEKIRQSIIGKVSGERFKLRFNTGELFKFSEENILEIERKNFLPPKPFRFFMIPRIGRFYPLGFFKGLKEVFPENYKPTRIIELNNKNMKIDTNIPIAKYELDLEVYIENVFYKTIENGGECKDWINIALENGPGIQVRYDGIETDFDIQNPDSFKREDDTEDSIFYSQPRITTHIDAKCHENLVKLYEEILPKKGKILDLMSSYQSHIPKSENLEVIGIGLNEEEMRQNPILNSFFIHDLNKSPYLPFSNEEFDAIVCDLSIEYVTRPFELINELKRILKPRGSLTFSFSNRYFPDKVIKLWIDLQEFERMGYVLELLLKTGGLEDFKTFSFRGFRRPYDDKYFGCTLLSDPLYVVYAKKS